MAILNVGSRIIQPNKKPWGKSYLKAGYLPLSSYVLSFDGVNDYVNLSGLEQEDSTDAPVRTMEVIIKPGTTSQSSGVIGSFHPDSYWKTNGRGIQYENGVVYALGAIGDGSKILSTSLTDLSQPHHIAAVFSSNGKLYIDGNLVDTGDISGNTNYQFNIGSDREGYSHNFDGIICEGRIWNTERTQAEIQDNMNRQLIGNEPGLVAYYPFTEGSGMTLTDATGNGNDGTINGATWVER